MHHSYIMIAGWFCSDCCENIYCSNSWQTRRYVWFSVYRCMCARYGFHLSYSAIKFPASGAGELFFNAKFWGDLLKRLSMSSFHFLTKRNLDQTVAKLSLFGRRMRPIVYLISFAGVYWGWGSFFFFFLCWCREGGVNRENMACAFEGLLH